MKKRSPIAAFALVVVGLIGLSLVPIAAAHTVKHDSTVTIHLKRNGGDPDSFSGKVISDSSRCERNRTIEIYRKREGEDKLIGTTETDADGKYELVLDGEAKGGTYYAVATRKVPRHDANHQHVCKRAESRELPVPSP